MARSWRHSVALGWRAYQVGDWRLAVEHGRRCVASHQDYGICHWLLACALERGGGFEEETQKAFAAANDAPHYPMESPQPVTWEAFAATVQAALDDLPQRFQSAIRRCAWDLSDYPPAHCYADLPLADGDAIFEPEELLGLFSGHDVGDHDGALCEPWPTPTVSIYRRPHEHMGGDLAEVLAEIRRTTYHEFGHYLGLDEDDLLAIDLD